MSSTLCRARWLASWTENSARRTRRAPPMWARRDLKSRLLTYARRAFSLMLVLIATLRGRLSGDRRLRPDPRALGRRDPDVGLPRPPRRARRLRPAGRLGRALRGDQGADPHPGRPPDRQPPGRDEPRRGRAARRRAGPRRGARRAHRLPQAPDRAHGAVRGRRSACWWRSRSAAGSRGCAGRSPFALVIADRHRRRDGDPDPAARRDRQPAVLRARPGHPARAGGGRGGAAHLRRARPGARRAARRPRAPGDRPRQAAEPRRPPGDHGRLRPAQQPVRARRAGADRRTAARCSSSAT